MGLRVRRMGVRRWLALLCGLVLSATACTTSTSGAGTATRTPTGAHTSTNSATSPPASPSPSASIARITFADCSHVINIPRSAFPSGRYDQLTFGCGRIEVPLDYSQPTGATTALEVIKIHFKAQPHRVGSLLTNPGGPGASGVLAAIGLAGRVADSVLSSFDLIGFDPRGVGLSSPVRCISDAMKDDLLAADPDVRNPAGLALDRAAYSQVAESCTNKYSSALQHYNTVETAMDMDRIRQAVGDPVMNYLGFSYGTLLGAVYAHFYPGTVRAEVLDGAVDPATWGDPIAFTEEQLKGFEDAFGQFAAWCVTASPCKELGDPAATLLSLETKASAQPLPSHDPTDSRAATGAIVQLAAIEALYDQSMWPDLAAALLKATKGDGGGLLALADEYSDRDSTGHYDNLLDIYQVVICNDQPVGKDPTDAQITAAADRWATQYPLFWRSQAASLAMCTGWQRDRHPVPPETAPTAKPMLVVGNINDPATPYVGAQRLTGELGNARLLTLDGEGHTSYLSSNCIAGAVNSYLVSGTVPAPDTTCQR